MFSRHNTSSTTSKGLLVQNTAEQEEYRKRTLAIQRELRAMAVSLSANRRRFLKKRAELLRRSTSVPGESSPAMKERRSADQERGNAAVRALSAVLERPRDEDHTEMDTRQNATDERDNEDVDRDESGKQQPSDTAVETAQTPSDQPYGERTRKISVSKHREDVSETIKDTNQETGNRKVSLDDDQPRRHARTSSMTESLRVDGTGRPVVNRRKIIRSPYARSARSDSVSVTVAPPPPKLEDSVVISRRMRGMTVGATEQLDLSRLRQICDVRVGAHSPDEEQEYMENTQQRIKDFLERTSADSVVSDPSDLASESGSAVVARRPSDRRRSVSRVYSLERSPRLRKRSVPSKLTDAIHEEEEHDPKDKLRLPPLSLPPVHNNVPMKLLPRNFSKRGHYSRESTRIWTAEEWADLKHCRYLRNKPIP